jgi:hypothetical protein
MVFLDANLVVYLSNDAQLKRFPDVIVEILS